MSSPLKPASVSGDGTKVGRPLTRAQSPVRGGGSGAGKERVDRDALAPAVMYECDGNLTVLSISPNVTELLRIRREHLLGNRALWEERLMADDHRLLLARLERLQPGELASETHRIIDDRGLPIWVAHGLRKDCTDSGSTVRGCMIPLVSVFQSKGLDSGDIAQFVHKIGNHFQLINLAISSLERSGAISKGTETLQETVNRAVELTRKFFHYSQVLTHPSAIDIGQILRVVIDSIAPVFLEKKVTLKDRLRESLNGAFINGDSVLLELAFGAILQNALEATEPGREVIIAGASQTCFDELSVAHVSVVDTGCGMEHSHLQKAPTPFFTSKPDRDGLGLSIAARLVELHGGRLSISSVKGRGTKVEIVLPLDPTANCDGK